MIECILVVDRKIECLAEVKNRPSFNPTLLLNKECQEEGVPCGWAALELKVRPDNVSLLEKLLNRHNFSILIGNEKWRINRPKVISSDSNGLIRLGFKLIELKLNMPR